MDDFEVAEAIYRAAVARWATARITLRRARGSCMRAGNRAFHSITLSARASSVGG
jgi:hypothetical protein